MISIQEQDFSVAEEHKKLLQAGISGAVVFFVGHVRRFSDDEYAEFFLQHYPGMTEKVLHKIEAEANKRWALTETRIIHRVGKLNVGDQIVFVGASGKHRSQTFDACEYMIDILKTEAPFWKKEGGHWVEARDSDSHLAERWMQADE